jgi:DegV family protein with EDD domain
MKMEPTFEHALHSGLDRLIASADILDRINVFPVADGDTGRNLVVSLLPVRQLSPDPAETVHRLLMAARGNSGNIAVRFFSSLVCMGCSRDLPCAFSQGRANAWQAVSKPVAGTMLTVFDDLVGYFDQNGSRFSKTDILPLINCLADSVKSTTEQIPVLKSAGVVDAGALGLFTFFEGFLTALVPGSTACMPITQRFDNVLDIHPEFSRELEEGFCIDTVIRLDPDSQITTEGLSRLGRDVVVIPHGDFLKVHLHTNDTTGIRKQMDQMGCILSWENDDLEQQSREFRGNKPSNGIHILTDAAGSVTRKDAREMGITLLDNYVATPDKSLPETLFSPAHIYGLMRQGIRVSTSQASEYERHQAFHTLVSQYDHVVYLSVGSVFTGNVENALSWKKAHDRENQFHVVDTTAASGRLALIVRAVVAYAETQTDPEAVTAYAKSTTAAAEEFIFLDKLKYLAASGRLSRPKTFFGDMLGLKPIISPTAGGAVKRGVARTPANQLAFACRKILQAQGLDNSALVLLEYSDNRDWVKNVAKKQISKHIPGIRILLRPLSLTSGVHMGPGTWALAFLPGQGSKYPQN